MKFSIIHFSDIHVPAEVSFSGLFDKRLLGCCNSLLIRKGRYNLELFRRAIPQFLEKKPSMFVFTGDAVSTADPREFEKALKEFQPLIDSRIPILYVPGNHDLYVRNKACRQAMENFYAALNGRAYSDAPYLYDAGPVRIAAIHCAKPLSWYFSCGVMSEDTSAFLREQYKDESSNVTPLLLAGHFPVITDHPRMDFRRKLYHAAAAAEGLQNGKLAVSFCGHIHKGYERKLDSGAMELCAGSLTKHGSYLEITYDTDAPSNGFCVTRHNVD
jgi:predicted phosphodiesterase